MDTLIGECPHYPTVHIISWGQIWMNIFGSGSRHNCLGSPPPPDPDPDPDPNLQCVTKYRKNQWDKLSLDEYFPDFPQERVQPCCVGINILFFNLTVFISQGQSIVHLLCFRWRRSWWDAHLICQFLFIKCVQVMCYPTYWCQMGWTWPTLNCIRLTIGGTHSGSRPHCPLLKGFSIIIHTCIDVD